MWQPEPIGPITDAFRLANYGEAVLWASMGVGFLIAAVRSGGRARWTCAAAGVALLAFGGSDVIEARTGAWWHPWWLLAWKGACLAVFTGLIIGGMRRRLRR
jgi:hypothetical protein